MRVWLERPRLRHRYASVHCLKKHSFCTSDLPRRMPKWHMRTARHMRLQRWIRRRDLHSPYVIFSLLAPVPHEMKLCATPASTASARHPECARAIRDGLVLAATFVRRMFSFHAHVDVHQQSAAAPVFMATALRLKRARVLMDGRESNATCPRARQRACTAPASAQAHSTPHRWCSSTRVSARRAGLEITVALVSCFFC